MGRALARLGQTTGSIAAFTRAESLLDGQLLSLPLGEGRAGLAMLREASAAGLTEALLRAGRPRAAWTAVRQARGRTIRRLFWQDRLATLAPERRLAWDAAMSRFMAARAELEEEARDAWAGAGETLERTQDRQGALAARAGRALEDAVDVLATPTVPAPASAAHTLPPGPPDELVLGYARLSGGWVGFAERGSRLTVRRLGPLDEVDFHALPFRGRPLVAGRPVTYGLDVSLRLQVGSSAPRRALLVADPTGNLPGARQEAELLSLGLRRAGILPLSLSGLDATRASVIARLQEVELFHYAGHGRYAGIEGLASELPLSDGGSLSLGDILALGRVPGRVVLLGCETAGAPGRAAPGLGVGAAFVLAGSREVVASVRTVGDASALALARELDESSTEPLGELLRRAQLSLRARNPEVDWSAFRVFVP
jgi:hypothetical protein